MNYDINRCLEELRKLMNKSFKCVNDISSNEDFVQLAKMCLITIPDIEHVLLSIRDGRYDNY